MLSNLYLKPSLRWLYRLLAGLSCKIYDFIMASCFISGVNQIFLRILLWHIVCTLSYRVISIFIGVLSYKFILFGKIQLKLTTVIVRLSIFILQRNSKDDIIHCSHLSCFYSNLSR